MSISNSFLPIEKRGNMMVDFNMATVTDLFELPPNHKIENITFDCWEAFVGEGCDLLTKLLLHFNGDTAAVTFVDSSLNNRAVRANVSGQCYQSAAHPKFGLTSLYFPGTTQSAVATVTASATPDFNFGAGDWTVECYARLAVINKTQVLLHFEDQTTGAAKGYNGWMLRVFSSGNTVRMYMSSAAGSLPYMESSVALAANTTYHIAVTCESLIKKMWIEGQLVSTYTGVTTLGTLTSAQASLRIGDNFIIMYG